MSEESTQIVETQIRVKAIDGDSIAAAQSLLLEVEGANELVLYLAELVVAILKEGLGAEIGRAMDGEGNVIPLGPTMIDPLAEDASAS